MPTGFQMFASLVLALAGSFSLGFGAPAQAEEFALSVSPPRFEIAAQSGQTVRGVAELTNASGTATQLSFSTADWELTPQGGVTLSAAMKPGSCRPWVAIERHEIVLPAKAQLRYRFEVTPPAGTAPTECRFAIVVSGSEASVSPGENVSFPVGGQIALIVYVTIGEARPKLRIVKAAVAAVNGVRTPVLIVENTGLAHGRLSAFLDGTDAAGKKREFAPSTLPILPGETRMIALNIENDGDAVEAQSRLPAPGGKAEPIAYPLTVGGIISDSISTFKFDGVFDP